MLEIVPVMERGEGGSRDADGDHENEPLHGDLETEVDGTKGDLTETEKGSNVALSEWEEGRIKDF